MRKHRKDSDPPKIKKCFIHRWRWDQAPGIRRDSKGREYVMETKWCPKCLTHKRPRKRYLNDPRR